MYRQMSDEKEGALLLTVSEKLEDLVRGRSRPMSGDLLKAAIDIIHTVRETTSNASSVAKGRRSLRDKPLSEGFIGDNPDSMTRIS